MGGEGKIEHLFVFLNGGLQLLQLLLQQIHLCSFSLKLLQQQIPLCSCGLKLLLQCVLTLP